MSAEMDKTTAEESVWFAMSATYGRELKAQEYLLSHDVECFVPMRYEIVNNRRQGKLRRLVPAITNLIFVRSTKSRIQELKRGIDYLQYHTQPIDGKKVPIVVPEAQMAQFMAVSKAQSEKVIYLTPDEVDVAKGTLVKIVGGAFDGIEGRFVKPTSARKRGVVILIEGVAAVMLAEVTDGFIQPLV